MSEEWLTPTQAALRLGVTRTAIRNRAKRGTLESMQDNRGLLKVRLPAPAPGTDAGDERHGSVDTVPQSVPRELYNQLRADLETERQRHTAEIERMISQIHAERTFWIERAEDQAEVRAEAAEQRAAEAQRQARELAERMARPWWRRMFE